jgi:hypothetical protein
MDIFERALVTTFEVLRDLDRVQGKAFWWNTYHVGKIAANIQIAMQNGVPFTEELIAALASGDEDMKDVNAFREKLPSHYKWLNESLDNIYSNQPADPVVHLDSIGEVHH